MNTKITVTLTRLQAEQLLKSSSDITGTCSVDEQVEFFGGKRKLNACWKAEQIITAALYQR